MKVLVVDVFLFHTGSIKRIAFYLKKVRFHKFLFHTGSIKSSRSRTRSW